MNTRMMSAVGLSFLAASMLTISCENEQDVGGKAHVVVRLTDAPADYEAVNVDIQDVQINTEGDSSGWISLDVSEGQYDLLQLTNGLDTLLGEADVPAGRINQIRLILGDDNTVVVDSMTFDLSTPSAQQSGLKVQIHTDFEEGATYEILLDFDAARSVHQTGNGTYVLRPVIRAIVEQTGSGELETGAIAGAVSPAASNPAIHVIQNLDTVSTMVDSVGNFYVGDLAVGTYRVVFVPITGFTGKELTGIGVIGGDTTDVGMVVIDPL